ncbi:hypothetical protein N7481_006084 [Penicillium waksmanii]|uniref:uncharacterized protein n=1 Tax=Penicillium waksmanii TaxID=69791 RepID=UPI0025482B83|nr:uncharacterized protein N7481_006084 [Penicillium waksmanii]KAJ5983985.1 hypothetical protein N7481_006084 [Penicillium waksmanii]
MDANLNASLQATPELPDRAEFTAKTPTPVNTIANPPESTMDLPIDTPGLPDRLELTEKTPASVNITANSPATTMNLPVDATATASSKEILHQATPELQDQVEFTEKTPTAVNATANPSTPNKAKRTTKKDFSNDKANLPDTEAELDDDQISSLFYQPPDVRKRYPVYFSKSTGKIHAAMKRLLFQRGKDNKLRHPEYVLRSNETSWEKKLLSYENPGQYKSKGEPIRLPDEEASRKRKRPTFEPVEPSSSRPTKINLTTDHQGSPLIVPGNAEANTQQLYPTANAIIDSAITAGAGCPMQPPLLNPYVQSTPINRLVAPYGSDFMHFLTKLEAGDLEHLTADDITLLTEWILKECSKIQQHVARAISINAGIEYRYILLDIYDNIIRVSRCCVNFEAERQNNLMTDRGEES